MRQVLHYTMGYLLTFWEKKGNFYIVALPGRLWVYIVALPGRLWVYIVVAQVAVLYMCGADSRRKQILAAQATASRSQQPRKQPQPAADDCIQSQPPVADDCIQPQPVAAASRQPQMTAYSRRQHRIGAARIASVRLPLAIRMSGEGLYARQHKKPLSMTGKTVRLRGFRAYIKALSFLSIVLLLKSSFVFGEDCIFDFVPRF